MLATSPRVLAARTSLTMTSRRWAETARVSVDPLTDALVLRVLRPPARSQVRTSLILSVDGEEYECSGRISGGRTGPYMLRYTPTILLRDGHIIRLGQTARHTLEAWVRFEVLRGDATIDLLDAWVTASIPTAFLIHHSVAFQAVSTGVESGGDGVLSLNHTAAGADLGVFAGVGQRITGAGAVASTSATYGGTGMTELWDLISSTAPDIANAGYHWPGGSTVPTGSQAVVSTLAGTPTPDDHILSVISLTGVHQTTPVGTPQTAEGTVGPATVTVTGLVADGLIIDNYVSGGAGETFTVGANQTQHPDPGTDATISVIRNSSQAGGAGGVMSWALTSGDRDYTLGAVEFKPAAAAAESVPYQPWAQRLPMMVADQLRYQ